MFTALARKSALFIPSAAVCGSSFVSNHFSRPSNDDNDDSSSSNYVSQQWNNTRIALCESSSGTEAQNRPAVLRKRMTSIGRFSMKSETKENPSIPAFFIALSGGPKQVREENGVKPAQGGMTSEEFEAKWMKSKIPSRHPRFHSRISPHDDRYFEYETEARGDVNRSTGDDSTEAETNDDPKAELHKHVTDTVHPASYRTDLRMRIERLMTNQLDLNEKLWEVYISSGLIGASGAISRLKTSMAKGAHGDADSSYASTASNRNCRGSDVESLLLFRSHHSLADGVSLISALGDLVDEAEEIREQIKAELKRRKKKSKERNLLQRLLRSLTNLIWFCLGSIQSLFYQMNLLWTTRGANPFEEALGLSSSTKERVAGRSISWCDVASLAEVKAVARAIGPMVTVNDVFVSCVSAAVTRQLEEHRERAAVMREIETGVSEKTEVVHPSSNMNVVVPVHLSGGVLLPGKSVGNNIGAFVVRVPAHMSYESETPASERLKQVHTALSAVKKSPTPILSYLFARFASDYLPEALAKRMFRNANANAAVVVSNARGWDKKVHINGRVVQSSHGFLPLPPGLPCGVVVQSYAGAVSISVTAEKWAVPDADRFVCWVLDEYRALAEETCSKH